VISIAAYLTLVTPQGPDASSIVADIDAYAQLAKSTWKVPGMAVAIIQGDKIIFEKCYGVRKYGGNDPITP
jgi:CubicO group peptidase (beta-lactamase class C family)